MHKKLVIAIDGPSASGKGTLAKKIAQHYDLAYLNTGAIYRAVALKMISLKISFDDFEHNISNLIANISEADFEKEELFDEVVGATASIIAKSFKLREALFKFQKNFVEEGKKNKNGCVLDGRDTTTIICPDADFKFFVTADVEIRAKRRSDQLGGDNYLEILEQLKKRDDNDFNRQIAPLKIADGAFIINNGNLSIEEGFQQALQIINSKK
jgi:cytidylate kinase